MRTRNRDITKYLQKHNGTSVIQTLQNTKIPTHTIYSLKPEQFFIPKDVHLISILTEMQRSINDNPVNLRNFFDLSVTNLCRRNNIVCMIRDFVQKYKLLNPTFFMAVYYFDLLILKGINLPIEKIGVGCLILSMKYNDIDGRLPPLRKFEVFFGISERELCKVEMYCLQKLDYLLSYSHIIHFIQIISIYGIIYTDDGFSNEKIIRSVYDLPYKIIETIIIKGNTYMKHNSFNLALASVCLARENIGVDKWNKAFDKYYMVSFDDILEEYTFIKE